MEFINNTINHIELVRLYISAVPLRYCSSVSLITEGIFLVVSESGSSSFTSLLLNTTYNIIDSEKHACALNGSLEGLLFNSEWVPDVGFSHVCDLTGVTVNTEVESLTSLGVLGS